MKRNKVFFSIGMMLAGSVVFLWLRRRLEEMQVEPGRPEAPAPLQKATTPLPAAEPAVKEDNLEEIDGIGATYARRLRAAGIRTFADLAALTPEQVRKAAKAQPWQGDPAAWIAQAKERT